jgi:hypothetical protein
MHRNADKLHIQQQVRHQAKHITGTDFFNTLTSPTLLGVVEEHLPSHRERLYHPTATLAMFLSQALHPDASCQQVVNELALDRVRDGLKPCSIRTGGYCRARQRLPVELPEQLTRSVATLIAKRSLAAWRWHNRRVKVVDGTTLSLPDTAANQDVYPQQSSQQPGVGFPIARVVGITCLSTGAVIDAAIGSFKGSSEHVLFRQLLGSFEPEDVVLADAYYSSYFLICALAARGADVVFQKYGARHVNFNRGIRLGSRDHVVHWPKPANKPRWMSPEDYQALPDELCMRELKAGNKILVTTLLCPKQNPKHELKSLYQQRWQVELNFRHIKTTLGMETLHCKTPAMVVKEFWIYLLAYNLIRLVMAEAASRNNRRPNQLSFKHALQLWVLWRQQPLLPSHVEHMDLLLTMIARLVVGNRPGRIEPRALKRRPKPFALLKKPRSEARDDVRKYGHVY